MHTHTHAHTNAHNTHTHKHAHTLTCTHHQPHCHCLCCHRSCAVLPVAMATPPVNPPGTNMCAVAPAVYHNPPAPCEDWQTGWVPPAPPVQWVAPYCITMQPCPVDGGEYYAANISENNHILVLVSLRCSYTVNRLLCIFMTNTFYLFKSATLFNTVLILFIYIPIHIFYIYFKAVVFILLYTCIFLCLKL